MKQYQDERTLQVRNRIYAELMRIMLCVVVLSFCIKNPAFFCQIKALTCTVNQCNIQFLFQ